MKTSHITLGALALAALLSVGTVAGIANAADPAPNTRTPGYGAHNGQNGHGKMMGKCPMLGKCPMMGKNAMHQLTSEQQTKYDAIMQEFNTKMTPIRDELWAKKMQLRALSNSQKATPEDVEKLTNEIIDLRKQYRSEVVNLDNRIEKEVGVKSNYATMGHRGMMGGGKKMGGGKMGGGKMGGGNGNHQ